MHPRREIRQAVAAALLGRTVAGDRVFATKVVAYRKDELPVLAVYTPDDATRADSALSAPRELDRDLTLVVEGWVMPTDGTRIDDAIDDLCEVVEHVMGEDPYFGGAAADSYLSGTDIEVLEDGDRLVGWVAMTYAFLYRSTAPDSPGAPSDFLRAGITYRIEIQDSQDLIEVRPPEKSGPIASFGLSEPLLTRILNQGDDVRVYLDRIGLYLSP